MSQEHGKGKIVLEGIAHYLMGAVTVLKGIEKAEHFREHPWLVVFLFAAGLFILIGAALHRAIEKRIPNFSKLFHVAEGLALIAVGLALLEKSARIPYFFLFTGFAYLAAGIFDFFTTPESKQRLAPRFAAAMGGAFVLFGAIAIALNTLGARNGWVYAIAGLMAAMGLLLLLARRRLFRK